MDDDEQQLINTLSRMMERTLTAEPEFLFEHDSDHRVAADLYLVWLIGHDDQTVAEWTTKAHPGSVIRMALPSNAGFLAKDDPTEMEPLRTAEYVLQNSWTRTHIDASGTAGLMLRKMIGPPADKSQMHYVIVGLRYRRRLNI